MPSPPPFRDARYLQLAVVLAYAITAREVFHFERSHWTTLGCVGVAIGLDLLIGRYYYRKVVFPLSAMIIGLASSLLIDARTGYLYLIVAGLAALSKGFVTYSGRHLFNPACFGVVLVLQLLPGHATGMPALFSGYLAPAIVFAILGFLTSAYARQLEVSLSWLGGFVLFGLARAWLADANPLHILAPAIAPGTLLFTFHMISDPATTPRTRKFRIGFGLAVAFIDAAIRYAQVPNAPFFALFAVGCTLPWIRELEEKPRGRPKPRAKGSGAGKAQVTVAMVWVGLFVFNELGQSRPFRPLGWQRVTQWLPHFRFGHFQYDSVFTRLHIYYYTVPGSPGPPRRLWDVVETPAWGWKEAHLDFQAMAYPRFLLYLCDAKLKKTGSFLFREFDMGEEGRDENPNPGDSPCGGTERM